MHAMLTRNSTSLRALFLAVVGWAIYLPGIPSYALAACQAARSQANSPLHRQLVAIQKFERQRQCSERSTSGFFNACRDLARRRIKVQQAIEAEGGSIGRACAAKVRPPQVAKRQKQSGQPKRVRPSPEGTPVAAAALFCVRLSDGYYFPAPKSQFAEVEQLSEAADKCRFICQDENVELFQLPTLKHETANMISIETGQEYTELTTAFRYRDDQKFESCNHKRYFERVNELRARTVTPHDLANAIIPLPTFRPSAVSEVNGDTELDVAGVSLEQTGSIRDVRIVGSPFFPE